jgi:hypothetical protein
MTRTNYGNGYKFMAIQKRRSNPSMVKIQQTRKDGSWGKVRETRVYGKETPEQVIERLTKLNPGTNFRLAEEG